MDAFKVLGLPITADEKSIKRAYARLLRQHRPDEDPAGFQRINEAYEFCLAIARRRQPAPSGNGNRSDDDTELNGRAEWARKASPLPRPMPPPDPRLRPPGADDYARQFRQRHALGAPPADTSMSATPFDLDSFLTQLFEQDARHDRRQFAAWLHGIEPLYSIDLKVAIGASLVMALCHREASLSPAGLETLLGFLDLESVGQYRHELVQPIEFLQARAEATLLRPAIDLSVNFEREFEWQRKRCVGGIDRSIFLELTGDADHRRRWLMALTPSLPGRLMRLARKLLDAGGPVAEEKLPAEPLAFWRRLTDRGAFDPARLFVVAIRGLVVAVLAWLASLASGQSLAESTATTGLVMFYMAAAWGLAALFGFCREHLARWQAANTSKDWLSRVVITSTLIALVVRLAVPEGPWPNGMFGLPLGLLAFRRPWVPRLDVIVAFFVLYVFAGSPLERVTWLPYSALPAMQATFAIGMIMLADWLDSRELNGNLRQSRQTKGVLWILAITALMGEGYLGLMISDRYLP